MAKKSGFFKEFKEFITRGNVLDMAVGIIIGGAFTAIITALVNNILTPLLQWVGVSEDGYGALQVVLRQATETSEAVVLDFGVVISAIITFLLTAFILFLIIKVVNRVHQRAEKAKAKLEARRAAEEPAPEVVEAAAEVPAEPAPAAPTAEELLTEIRDLLKTINADKPTETDQKD